MRDNIPSNFADTPYCHHATNLCHHFLISVFQLLPFLVSLFGIATQLMPLIGQMETTTPQSIHAVLHLHNAGEEPFIEVGSAEAENPLH